MPRRGDLKRTTLRGIPQWILFWINWPGPLLRRRARGGLRWGGCLVVGLEMV